MFCEVSKNWSTRSLLAVITVCNIYVYFYDQLGLDTWSQLSMVLFLLCSGSVSEAQKVVGVTLADLREQVDQADIRPTLSDDQLHSNSQRVQV